MLGFAAQCSEAPPLSPLPVPLVFADVNLDQIVNVQDTVVLVDYIVNGQLPVGVAFTAADVNSSGELDVSVRHPSPDNKKRPVGTQSV